MLKRKKVIMGATMKEQEPTQTKPARGPSLLNKTHVREYILERAKQLRQVWHPERVSAEAVEMLEYKLRRIIDAKAIPIIEEELRRIIDQSITGHPTKGVTFTQVL